MLALRSDGTVRAWGNNSNGQFGRKLAAGGRSSAPAPVLRQSDGQPLTGIVGVKMTSSNETSVLACTAAGVAWKWGHAWFEPGLGGIPQQRVPVHRAPRATWTAAPRRGR